MTITIAPVYARSVTVGNVMSIKEAIEDNNQQTGDGYRSALMAIRAAAGLTPDEYIKKFAPAHKTWRGWLNPIVPGYWDETIPGSRYLVSRDDILTKLQSVNVDVKVNDLVYWERKGILPKGERQWDPEARAVRSFYPRWWIGPLFLLRVLQSRGMSLKDITPHLKKFSEEMSATVYEMFEEFSELAPTEKVAKIIQWQLRKFLVQSILAPEVAEFGQMLNTFFEDNPIHRAKVVFKHGGDKESENRPILIPKGRYDKLIFESMSDMEKNSNT